jgi:hypothetical protein
MKAKLLICFTLLLACSSFYAFRLADDPFEDILKKLTTYNDGHPQEKVYLHLDKPYYAIGDNIWFKAYVVNAAENKLTGISSAVYVELINENDSVKKQIKLPLTAGLAWGDFKLADTLQEGNYRIRAYTQWMRNASPEYFFDKTIKIGNAWANQVFTNTVYTFSKKEAEEQVGAVIKFTDKQGEPYGGQPVAYQVWLKDKQVARGKGITGANGALSLSFTAKPGAAVSGKIIAMITLQNKQEVIKNIPVTAISNNADIQLFPEGGNIIEGLPVKVAVKVVNAAGLGEDISGVLLDNSGTEVLTFKTAHLGMGNFILNAQPGRTYTVKAKLKDGTEKVVPLPKVLPAGYSLTVNNMDSTKISAKVMISEGLLNPGEMKLVIQYNNAIYAVLKAKSQKQVTSFSIPKKDMPSGIFHLTVFTPANLPVCERLVFINNPQDQISVSLDNLKGEYGTRGHMALHLMARDGGKPTIGSFSVAITNTSIVEPDPDRESNILASLLLTSDLKGFVERPGYYFNEKGQQAVTDLDNLMLTQGWSRFAWTDITGGAVPKPLAFKPETMLKVSGTIRTLGGKPIAQGKISLLSTSGGMFLIDTLSDANGHFSFDNLVFGDSTRFVVQARNVKNKKNVEINLDIVPGQVVTKNKNTGDVEVNVNEAIQSYIQKSVGYFDELNKRGMLERTLLLDQVNIVQKKNPAKNSANLNGAGMADAIITAKDLQTAINIPQYLQGRVAGMIIRNGQAYLLRNNGTPMTVVLDGMNVGPDFLDNLIPQDIETIEVLKSIGNTAIYGAQGGGGVLVVTTKRGGSDMSYSRYSPGIITYSPKGYYTAREFYSPQYTPGNNIQGEDRRTTVFWTPHILTAADGTAKINYYNTDEPGTYRMVIEGINDDGHLARKVYTYAVK